MKVQRRSASTLLCKQSDEGNLDLSQCALAPQLPHPPKNSPNPFASLDVGMCNLQCPLEQPWSPSPSAATGSSGSKPHGTAETGRFWCAPSYFVNVANVVNGHGGFIEEAVGTSSLVISTKFLQALLPMPAHVFPQRLRFRATRGFPCAATFLAATDSTGAPAHATTRIPSVHHV